MSEELQLPGLEDIEFNSPFYPISLKIVKEVRKLAKQQQLTAQMLEQVALSPRYTNTLLRAANLEVKSGGREKGFWVGRNKRGNSVLVSRIFGTKQDRELESHDLEHTTSISNMWAYEALRKMILNYKDQIIAYPIMFFHQHPITWESEKWEDVILPSTSDLDVDLNQMELNPNMIFVIGVVDNRHGVGSSKLLFYQKDPLKELQPQVYQNAGEDFPLEILTEAGFRYQIVSFPQKGSFAPEDIAKIKTFCVS